MGVLDVVMQKAPIKLEGYIGNVKVCHDLILGANSKHPAFSDSYGKMLYVRIDGLKNTTSSAAKEDQDNFDEVESPVNETDLEQKFLEKRQTSI